MRQLEERTAKAVVRSDGDRRRDSRKRIAREVVESSASGILEIKSLGRRNRRVPESIMLWLARGGEFTESVVYS